MNEGAAIVHICHRGFKKRERKKGEGLDVTAGPITSHIRSQYISSYDVCDRV